MANKPRLVSCLMVTGGGRPGLRYWDKSLDAYCRQTHPDRELLIVADGLSPRAQAEMASAVERRNAKRDIRLIFQPGRHRQGELRNTGLRHARGDMLCQWDDDALYDPERIATQLSGLLQQKNGGIFLQQVFRLGSSDGALRLQDFGKFHRQFHPGTALCFLEKRLRYDERAPEAFLAEELIFAGQLKDICVISDMPELCVYLSPVDSTTEFLSAPRKLLLQRKSEIEKMMGRLGLAEAGVRI